MKKLTNFFAKLIILTLICTALIVQTSFALSADIPLDFTPCDSVSHPTKPIVYMTDKLNKKLVAVNYETGQKTSLAFNLAPESLTYGNNKIYVCLLKAEHNFYISDASQTGAVAVVDPDTLFLNEQFDINLDPFDIAIGRDGYIYIASGSGQWTKMKSYLRQPAQGTASTGIRTRSYAELHPTLNRIYTITTDSSPRDYYAYNIANGQFTDPVYPGGYDSPYHGDYPLNKNFKISPDGSYLFNGSGVIFKTASDKPNDMKYHARLSSSFSDIAFDISNNRFFTGSTTGAYIYTCNYTTLAKTASYYLGYGLNLVTLNYTGGKLICLSKSSTGAYYVDAFNASSTYLSPLKRTAISVVPADTFVHPTKPVVYLTDKANKKLYSVNYETGQISSIAFGLMAESIGFANNEIFVCLLKADHDFYLPDENQSGAIAIVDPETFTLKEQFEINLDPFDIVLGRDGFIYIPSGSGQWTKMKSYTRPQVREIASTGIRTRSYAELHPALNRIYTITTDTSPRDYNAYNIAAGLFTDPVYPGGYDSPYHGDYPLNKNFRISPDGKYLFNGSGVIFKTEPDRANDMRYYAKLDSAFSDVSFDLAANRFFAAAPTGLIHVYDYNTLQKTTTYTPKGSVLNLYYKANKLVAISKTAAGSYIIETLDV